MFRLSPRPVARLLAAAAVSAGVAIGMFSSSALARADAVDVQAESPSPAAASDGRPAQAVAPERPTEAPYVAGVGSLPALPNELKLTRPVYLQTGMGNPADAIRPHGAATTRPAGTPVDTATPGPRLRSDQLPAIEVVGEKPFSDLKEEERVGDNEQPRWTAARRFPGTRIYVIPENTAEFEFWFRPTVPRNGGDTEIRTLYEIELGLPYRFQLDIYLRTESTSNGPTQVGESIELRYAFAKWNEIWGNPTLYAEYSRLEDESDAIEFKLLLGGEIAPRWHWGINLSDELATGGDRANEIEITGGISYTVIDSKLSIGLETECGVVDTKGNRGHFDEKFFFLGPSIQYRPTEQTHIDFAPLIGLTGDTPVFRAYLILGYEF